jgi:hypothetical protein
MTLDELLIIITDLIGANSRALFTVNYSKLLGLYEQPLLANPLSLSHIFTRLAYLVRHINKFHTFCARADRAIRKIMRLVCGTRL